MDDLELLEPHEADFWNNLSEWQRATLRESASLLNKDLRDLILMRFNSVDPHPPERLGLSAPLDNDITAGNMDFDFSSLDLDMSELLNEDTTDFYLTENAGNSMVTQSEADPYPFLYQNCYTGFHQSLNLFQSNLNIPPQCDSLEASDQRLVLGVNETNRSSCPLSLSPRQNGTTTVSDISTQSSSFDSWINISPPPEREDLLDQAQCPSSSDKNSSDITESKTHSPGNYIRNNIPTCVSYNNWFIPAVSMTKTCSEYSEIKTESSGTDYPGRKTKV